MCARHPLLTTIQRNPVFLRRHPDADRDASGIARTLRKTVGYATMMVSIPVLRMHFSPAEEGKILKRSCFYGKKMVYYIYSLPRSVGSMKPTGHFLSIASSLPHDNMSFFLSAAQLIKTAYQIISKIIP
jgi:hypothetical protein